MTWKPEYEENRRKREELNPELRAKRIASSKRSALARKAEIKQYMKEYAKANREKFRRTPEQQARYNERRRKKYAEDSAIREKARAKVKEWQQRNPIKRKAQRIKRYNLTIQDFQALMESQNGRCAICGYKDASVKSFFPMVDHCHKTGKVRGILCSNCNLAIGKLKDSIPLLRSAIAYLENFETNG